MPLRSFPTPEPLRICSSSRSASAILCASSTSSCTESSDCTSNWRETSDLASMVELNSNSSSRNRPAVRAPIRTVEPERRITRRLSDCCAVFVDRGDAGRVCREPEQSPVTGAGDVGNATPRPSAAVNPSACIVVTGNAAPTTILPRVCVVGVSLIRDMIGLSKLSPARPRQRGVYQLAPARFVSGYQRRRLHRQPEPTTLPLIEIHAGDFPKCRLTPGASPRNSLPSSSCRQPCSHFLPCAAIAASRRSFNSRPTASIASSIRSSISPIGTSSI